MKKEVEIEKRFLVSDAIAQKLIKESGAKGTKMVDVYVPNGGAHMDLRLRLNGDETCITRKVPAKENGQDTMIEQTIAINVNEWTNLSSGIETVVAKHRYNVNFFGKQADLDIFDGRHEGLIILEVEFASRDEMDEFMSSQPYATEIEEDITGVKEYKGGNLAIV